MLLYVHWLFVHLASVPTARRRLVSKCAYTANKDSPLGQNTELDLCQFDKMTMIAPHPSQEFWWLVEMDDGRRGYVPSNYVMVCHVLLQSIVFNSGSMARKQKTTVHTNRKTHTHYTHVSALCHSVHFWRLILRGCRSVSMERAAVQSRWHWAIADYFQCPHTYFPQCWSPRRNCDIYDFFVPHKCTYLLTHTQWTNTHKKLPIKCHTDFIYSLKVLQHIEMHHRCSVKCS